MNKFVKCSLLLLFSLSLFGCALPFQSSEYPAWDTKGLLEYYTLSDGRVIGGWLGTSIGEEIEAKWYKFTVNSVEEVDSYKDYKPGDNNTLYHASITITNTSEKDVYLFDSDFALVWNLESDDPSYAYSIDAIDDSMLVNEMVIKIGETKTIDTVYEVSKDVKKPMAIYYFEQYSDNQKGNKYYVYIR